MSEHKPVIVSQPGAPHATLKAYQIGFISSVVITLVAYGSVVNHLLSRRWLIAAVAALAVVQFTVQLLYFLHLGKETKPRWKLMVFGFMLGVIIIVIVGSLWIMANLNYRMSPKQMNQYLQSQDGL